MLAEDSAVVGCVRGDREYRDLGDPFVESTNHLTSNVTKTREMVVNRDSSILEEVVEGGTDTWVSTLNVHKLSPRWYIQSRMLHKLLNLTENTHTHTLSTR